MEWTLKTSLGGKSAIEAGLGIRAETIRFFSSKDFLDRLEAVLAGEPLADVIELPGALRARDVLSDMAQDQNWAEEHWTISDEGTVELVDQRRFERAEPRHRFSVSDTLRRPSADAYALRGLLSGLHSPVVLDAFSAVAGTRGAGYKSADIARYRPGHYLRRHDDLYDGRLFGLVFFVHEGWKPEYGTHLIAEKPDGRCQVVPPKAASVAMMRLAGGHFHQVQPNLSAEWHRYSLAVHFGVGASDGE
ncbi:2OG-Fe(II) oxygenase family protein [Leifsonia sp. NPDC077715]|uniref:2OG-Fe(II) oxygenase family protein n=1 Tax=Leifsonia sp. NPDC077715 TaxID=3155539 RepID=UPI00342AEBC8